MPSPSSPPSTPRNCDVGHDVGQELDQACASALTLHWSMPRGGAGTGACGEGQAEAATRLRHLVDEALHARLVQVIVVGVVHTKPEDGGQPQPLQALPERGLRARRRVVVLADALSERRAPCGVEPREAERGAVKLPEEAAWVTTRASVAAVRPR